MPKSVLFQHLFTIIKTKSAKPTDIKLLLHEALRRSLFDSLFDLYDQFDINSVLYGQCLFDMSLKLGSFYFQELIAFNPRGLVDHDPDFNALFAKSFARIKKKSSKILERNFKNKVLGAFELKQLSNKKLVNKLFISALTRKDEKHIVAFLKRLPKLMDFPIKVSKIKCHLIHWAVAKNMCYLVNFLLKIDPNLIAIKFNKTLDTPLHIAIKYGKIQAFKLLITKGCLALELNKKKQSALMSALIYQSQKVASVIFKCWFDKNLPIDYGHKDLNGKTLFDYAISDHPEVLKLILPFYIESLRLDQVRFQRCFIFCAMNNQSSSLPLLLNNLPVDLNEPAGTLRRTAIFFSVENNDYKNTDLYINYGANVNIQDKLGETPLMLAIKGKFHAIIDLLLACKDISLSICSKGGKHALSLALDTLNEDLACKILEKIKDNSDKSGIMRGAGLSILHIAALYGDKKTILFMMRKTNYPVDVKSTKGETPLQVASRAGHHDAVALLMEFGRSSVDSYQKQDRLSPTRLPRLNMT